jgi:hypothetical protein
MSSGVQKQGHEIFQPIFAIMAIVTKNVIIAVCLCFPLLAVVNGFGAGNIPNHSGLEHTRYRHGDIEDIVSTIIEKWASKKKKDTGVMGRLSLKNNHWTKEFGKADMKAVYLGNWLRDYSQLIDNAALKVVDQSILETTIKIFAFMDFGYGTRDFLVDTKDIGCYRPDEHIDNPKGYSGIEGHPCLRGKVNSRELEIDPNSGAKNYITSTVITACS